jgi:hypothetical protein
LILYYTINMLKLVSDKGRWATKDNSMIFGTVVYLVDESDIRLYHLIDKNKKEINVDILSCLVDN